MDFANLGTTNILLGILTLVAVGQFVILLAVILSVKNSVAEAKREISRLMGGEIRDLRLRADRVLDELETLITRGNTILGAVEQGAQEVGSAASAVSHGAQRALAAGSLEVRAVTSAVRSGLQWFLQNVRGFGSPAPATHVNSGDARG